MSKRNRYARVKALPVAAAAVLAAPIVLAGCGSSDMPAQATSDRASSATAVAITTRAARVGTERPAESTRDEQRNGPDFFQSPSKNIFCVGSAAGPTVRCDIVEKTYATPVEAECTDSDGGGNDGRTLSLTGSEPGRFGCPSDSTISPGSPVMPYGTTKRFGTIECDMSESGIRCDSQAGHGFFLSRGTAYGY